MTANCPNHEAEDDKEWETKKDKSRPCAMCKGVGHNAGHHRARTEGELAASGR